MKRMLAGTLVVAAITLVACGGSSKKGTSTSTSSSPAPAQTQSQPQTSPSAATGTVSIGADPSGNLRFSTSQATAKAGAVTLNFSNPSPIEHGLSVEGAGIDKTGKIISSGQSASLTVNLRPGKYTFYCPVPGHRAAGMKGTLTVQ